jgi:ComF family protein
MRVLSVFEDFISFFYPNTCYACGNSLFKHEKILCTHCLCDLPKTNYHLHAGNPLDQVFWGRVKIEQATAFYYFSKGSKVQHLIHQLKYRGKKEIGIYLGKLLGNELKDIPSFHEISVVIPVPLHPRKQRKRGYNQSEQFAIGLAEAMGIKMDAKSFVRTVATETQTKKSRFARWENVKEIFAVTDPVSLEGRHLLLVDDVVTTGATIESCANTLLGLPGVKVSVASIACAHK